MTDPECLDRLMEDIQVLHQNKANEKSAHIAKKSKKTVVKLPGAMTRKAQMQERKRGKMKTGLVFSTDGVYFFTSKRLLSLYERTKHHHILQRKLVNNTKMTDRDRFSFNQAWNDCDEKHDHLAKLLREAHNSRTCLRCHCKDDRKEKHVIARATRMEYTQKLSNDRKRERKEEEKTAANKDCQDELDQSTGQIGSSSKEESIIRERTEQENMRKSVVDGTFMDFTVGMKEQIKYTYLLFILSLDDVTQQSIDMEVELLVEKERRRKEENMKLLAFNQFDNNPNQSDHSDVDAVVDENDETNSDTEADQFASDMEYVETSSEENDGPCDDDGSTKNDGRRKKQGIDSNHNRENMIVTPSLQLNFNVLYWIFFHLKSNFNIVETEGEGIFVDLTGSEGQICLCASLCAAFEYTIGFEDNIEAHEIACRLEDCLSERVRGIRKQRKYNGFSTGLYDVKKLTYDHLWIQNEWCGENKRPDGQTIDVDDNAEKTGAIYRIKERVVQDNGTQKPRWALASVLFVDTTLLKPDGYVQRRGQRRTMLSKMMAQIRLSRVFRHRRWYKNVWKGRMDAKIKLLRHHMHWLRRGTIVIVATPSKSRLGFRGHLHLDDDSVTWEGPISPVNYFSNVPEDYLMLNGRSLYVGQEPMNFSFWKKKTRSNFVGLCRKA